MIHAESSSQSSMPTLEISNNVETFSSDASNQETKDDVMSQEFPRYLHRVVGAQSVSVS